MPKSQNKSTEGLWVRFQGLYRPLIQKVSEIYEDGSVHLVDGQKL